MDEKSNKEIKALIITIIAFSIYLFVRQYFQPIKTSLDKITQWGLFSYFLTYLIIGIPIFLGTVLINRKINILKELGLINSIIKPLGWALVFTLPMIIGGLIFYNFNTDWDINNLLAGSLVIGLVEELFFRGFLFGQVYKNTRLGFIPAIFIGAVVFASGHLYQSQELGELIGIFAVTFMGAILYAWLYVEWDYNLWLPIFLHALMNLTWHIFEMDETALGGLLPNFIRALTIFAAISLTIFIKRKKGIDLSINRYVLLYKENG
jgi:membrane protease YdiL (CAAX protease family)